MCASGLVARLYKRGAFRIAGRADARAAIDHAYRTTGRDRMAAGACLAEQPAGFEQALSLLHED
jgi:hypothetical protein